MNDPLIYLTCLFVFGMTAQWLAWRFHLPAILLLLGFGFVVGAFTDSQEIINDDLLFPFVSLSVAVILFDGGLSLRFSELKETRSVVIRLVTIGCLITWGLATVAGRLIFSTWEIAALAGAIFTVTGPTVIGPLLRQIRPVRSVGSIAKWEGIVIDPIGALLAVLVFQVVAAGEGTSVTMQTVSTLGTTLVVCVGIGLGLGWFLIWAFKNHYLPDFLQSPVLLASVLASFTVSNLIQAESGLATVTLLGIMLANQKHTPISHLIEFKENLGVLLISILFILLASRLQWDQVYLLGSLSALFIAILILLIRPIAILGSTIGTSLPFNARLFLSWLAPRGIVAAAVASVFSLELAHHHAPGAPVISDEILHDADLLVPLTFLTIVSTVTVYGLTASWLAKRLNLADQSPQGILFAGADELVRKIAFAVKEENIQVQLVNTNHENVKKARMMGLPTTLASINSEYIHEEVDLGGIGRMIAMTPNDQVNTLAAVEYIEQFGRANVYQLKPVSSDSSKRIQATSKHARYVFEDGTTRDELQKKIRDGYVVKSTGITEEFSFEQFKELNRNEFDLLFVKDSSGKLSIRTDAEESVPKPGQNDYCTRSRNGMMKNFRKTIRFRITVLFLLLFSAFNFACQNETGRNLPQANQINVVQTSKEKTYGGITLEQWKGRLKNFNPKDKANHKLIPALLELVKDDSLKWHTRQTAALALARMGEPAKEAIPVLVELSDSKNNPEETQFWAGKAIAKFGTVAKKLTPTLKERLEKQEGSILVRLTYIDALSQIGTNHPQAIPTLIDILKSQKGTVKERRMLRNATLLGLMSLGPNASPATLTLIDTLSDSDTEMRNKAVMTLGQIGPAAQPAIPSIAELLIFEESIEVRKNAASTLISIGQAAGPTIKNLLNDEDVKIRRTLASAVSTNKFLFPEFSEAFEKLRTDPDDLVRLAAIQGLLQIKKNRTNPEFLDDFESLLTSQNRSVRIEAIKTVVKLPLKSEKILKKFDRLRDHTRPEVRSAYRELEKRLERRTVQ